MATLYDDLIRDAVKTGTPAQTTLDGDYAQLAHTHPFTEINPAVSYTETAPAAIPAGTNVIELNHATVAIEKTIASLANHQGLMVVKDTSASGTAAHKITVTTGTWDGTNKVITLNAPKECIVVFIDSAGNGTIVQNVGAVALS